MRVLIEPAKALSVWKREERSGADGVIQQCISYDRSQILRAAFRWNKSEQPARFLALDRLGRSHAAQGGLESTGDGSSSQKPEVHLQRGYLLAAFLFRLGFAVGRAGWIAS